MASTFTFTVQANAYGDNATGPAKTVKTVTAQTAADSVPTTASTWFTVPHLGSPGLPHVAFTFSVATKNNADNTADIDLYYLADVDGDGTKEVVFHTINLAQYASGETEQGVVNVTNLQPGEYFLRLHNLAGT